MPSYNYEKVALEDPNDGLPIACAPPPPRRTIKSRLIFLVLGVLIVSAYTSGLHRCAFNGHADLSSSSHKVGQLRQVKCWDDVDASLYECFRMLAPLDHNNAEKDHRKADIALVRYRAGGGKTKKSDIKGTMFFNPGGPGGSGIGFLTRAVKRPDAPKSGSQAQFIDQLLQGKWNLMSFDPRGIGHTLPRADCFDSPNTNGGPIFSQLFGYEQLPSGSETAISRNLAHLRLAGDACASKAGLADKLQYVSTPAVARDMRLFYKAVGDEKLNYWGYSYGSVLGSVYADMFPDEVGAFAVDGVVDVENYLAGDWSNNFLDTEAVLKGIFWECAKAGDKCALTAVLKDADVALPQGEVEAAALFMRQKVDELIEDLIRAPRPAIGGKLPQLLTHTMIKDAIFQSLYRPIGWPKLASALAQSIVDKNDTAFVDTYGLSPESPKDKNKKKPAPYSAQAPSAIAGADALQIVPNYSEGNYKADMDQLARDSPFSAEMWINIRAGLQSWKIRGAERHKGTFNSTTTSNPILFIGNDYDPVTPIAYARKMSSKFPRSAVLRIKSYGHCSLSQPSRCASKAIRDFFNEGKLPGPDEIGCEVDYQPYDAPSSEEHLSTMDDEARLATELSFAFSEARDRSFGPL